MHHSAASLVFLLAFTTTAQRTLANERVSLQTDERQVVVSIDAKPVATYVFSDEHIRRPYFAHVRAPDGTQVTRNHPPIAGQDRTDHDTMHPGIWLAFGDLNGADFWRNKADVRHVKFLQMPRVETADHANGAQLKGAFTELKQYTDASGAPVCQEIFQWTIEPLGAGYLMTWDSTFTSPQEFTFGDQEEMGLGLRVATPIAEVNGGGLLDSEDRRGAKQIWSQAAEWCDYSGTVADRRLGMTLMCHPANFRESWLHARDYGFVAANPFGRKAMKKGEVSQVTVKPGEELRLRYGIWCYAMPANETPQLDEVYQDYLQRTQESPANR